jgi:type IV fimbrial biogenesis protein FimT
MVGLPSLTTWLQNTQVRGAAEAMQAGLQLARAEALRRNAPVRFQLVDTLTSACALSGNGANWIVSINDPTALCDQAPSDTVAPFTIQKYSSAEGSSNAAVRATGGQVVIFSGLGRVSISGAAPAPITQIDVRHVSDPNGGNCQPAGRMRCLRLNISNGGQTRMCDPAVTDITDSRFCG